MKTVRNSDGHYDSGKVSNPILLLDSGKWETDI